MTWFANTLWDLLKPPKPVRPAARPRRPSSPKDGESSRAPGSGKPSMQQRYDALVAEMKTAYGVRVRKWRSSSSGCAWEVRYDDGSTARLVEAPYPRGPISCAVFLHEIGHHAIGFGRYSPRCLEEYHAWRWALDTMRQRKFNVTAAVEKRMAESLRYAVAKARRRGLRAVPPVLLPYLPHGSAIEA